jgi:hypothetical protein
VRLDKFNPTGLGFGISLDFILLQQAWLVQQALANAAHSLQRHQNRGFPGKYLINRRWTNRFYLLSTILLVSAAQLVSQLPDLFSQLQDRPGANNLCFF